ncbi:Na+-transporting NADH:ubiquinone oxidoreductase, subunit NqrB, partial [Anabaena aphanizomenioides LEGE 00250]|nr:Na+-transporting NADH:ubiquinone oxidoreductase, subunit NqrB [Sphaerospermopsis aphanizomenoides LEGE 00250]
SPCSLSSSLSPVTSHQSPVPSPQSPVPSHQSPITYLPTFSPKQQPHLPIDPVQRVY